jgi:VIT1/CCC1 family predicted Fe2+/Mn2+ transporter
LPGFTSHRKSAGIRQLLIGLAAAGVTLGVGLLLGAAVKPNFDHILI